MGLREDGVEKKESTSSGGLEDFKKYVTKNFGKGTMISAFEKQNYGDVIPCTSFSLRHALGIGGFAKNKLYTIDGDLSSGKSTTGYDIIGHCQKTYGERCLLLDKEDSYTTDYGALLGVDNDMLDIITPHSLEDMYEILQKALESKCYGVILIDSVTSFAPDSRHEGSGVLGVEARVNSDKMRLIVDALYKSNCCVIMIQQTRSAIGGMGDPTRISGGSAIPFYAHVRIRITRSKIDRENRENIMKFTVIKNKMAPVFLHGIIAYVWGVGFDFSSEIAQLSVDFGIIKLEGKSYYPPETDGLKLVGKKKLTDYLSDNPEYTKSVLEPLVLQVLNQTDYVTDSANENELY